jgi:hypothetical protein
MNLCINHDFCTAPFHVRYWMNSGKQMLSLSFSGFDPQQMSGPLIDPNQCVGRQMMPA